MAANQTARVPQKLKTRLVGVVFEKAQHNLKEYRKGPLRLVFERNNPHHNKAVKVMNGSACLGYLPREIAELVVDRWDQDRVAYKIVWARVVGKQNHDTVGMRLVLEEKRYEKQEETRL